MAVELNKQPVINLIINPPAPLQESSSFLDSIKKIAGTILAILGLAILVGASLALGGKLIGLTPFDAESIHGLFMTGIASALGGFHMAKGGSASTGAELTVGPLSVAT